MSKLCKYRWVSGSSFLDGVKPWMAADLSTRRQTSGDAYLYMFLVSHTVMARPPKLKKCPRNKLNRPYILVSTKYSTVVIIHQCLVFDSAGFSLCELGTCCVDNPQAALFSVPLEKQARNLQAMPSTALNRGQCRHALGSKNE